MKRYWENFLTAAFVVDQFDGLVIFPIQYSWEIKLFVSVAVMIMTRKNVHLKQGVLFTKRTAF